MKPVGTNSNEQKGLDPIPSGCNCDYGRYNSCIGKLTEMTQQNNSKPPFYLTFTPERLKEVLFAGLQVTYGMGFEGSYVGVSEVQFAKRPQGPNNELTDVYIFTFPAKEEGKEKTLEEKLADFADEAEFLPLFLDKLQELENVWINELPVNVPTTLEGLVNLESERLSYADGSGDWHFSLGEGWTFEVLGGGTPEDFSYRLHTTFMERNYWFYLDGTKDDD